MPEVNVIIVTNVMMRSHYLGKRLTENVKYLGFWEKLSALEFKTIAARMTSLNQEQTEELLDKLNLHPKEQRYMVRICVCVCVCLSVFNNFCRLHCKYQMISLLFAPEINASALWKVCDSILFLHDKNSITGMINQLD